MELGLKCQQHPLPHLLFPMHKKVNDSNCKWAASAFESLNPKSIAKVLFKACAVLQVDLCICSVVLMNWIQEILLLYLCLRTLNSNSQMVMILQVLGVPYKCVSFVLEDANLLNGTKMCECLLQQLLWKATGNAATVHGAIGRTRLVIHFIKRQRLWITWKAQNVIRQLGISFLSPVLVLFGDLPVFSLLGLFIDYIFWN